MAETQAEKWMKGVAITTTCLAVMTSIAAARGTSCVSKGQLLTAIEGSKWAYYQAKSIKQNMTEMQKNIYEAEIVGAVNQAQKVVYESKLKIAAQEASRYDQEKNQIRKEAEEAGALNKLLARKGTLLTGSVIFFQLAIMLSSVSALLKKKYMWLVGLVFGSIAAVLLAYGLFLKPLLF